MNVRGEPVRPVPDQVILVTGATDGLGKAVARELASRRATVLLHGRDTARGEATLHEIRQATGNDRLRVSLADFSSLAQVRRLAEAILAGTERLDLLINNAGVGGRSPRQESQDGHELRFAVNYLAPFLLTHLLLPLLRRSAPARIVNVASAGQAPIDFDDMMLTRTLIPWTPTGRASSRRSWTPSSWPSGCAPRGKPESPSTRCALPRSCPRRWCSNFHDLP